MGREEELSASKKPVGTQAARRTILVVEDDRSHRTFMEQILKDAGFATVPAENGLVALARLDNGPKFDLVVMDWDMPALNGLEAVKAMRARQINEGAAHIPVIAFTGKRQPGDREKCLAAGMDAYLPKDVWMPKWRQSLIENLELLMTGNGDASGLATLAAAPPPEEIRTEFDLDSFNSAALEEVKALLRGGFCEMVDEYLEDAAKYIKEIQAGLQAGDAKRVERGSHPLKSNSKGLGLMAVSSIAESINLLSQQALKKQGTLKPVEKLLPLLQEAFRRAEKKLRAAVTRH